MRVVVFGASGGVGAHVLRQALQAGHNVTAFARNPSKLIQDERLRVVTGDVFDADDVARAVENQDAVVSALGTGRGKRNYTPVCSYGTENILAAMDRHGVKRLVVVSSYGVSATRKRLSWVVRAVFRVLLADALADKDRMEQHILESDVEWTVLRPVRLTREPARESTQTSVNGTIPGTSIPRANVAQFALAQLSSDTFVRQSVMIA